MWRRRFLTGTNAFPRPVGTVANRLIFDEDEVAQWLEVTGHGNNPDARADAASAAAPADLSFAVDDDVAELEALIALQGQTGALAGRTATALREDAGRTDPDDLTIRSEIEQYLRSGRDWGAFVDRFVDAAYSPAGALDVVAQRSKAAATSSGSDARRHGARLAATAAAPRRRRRRRPRHAARRAGARRRRPHTDAGSAVAPVPSSAPGVGPLVDRSRTPFGSSPDRPDSALRRRYRRGRPHYRRRSRTAAPLRRHRGRPRSCPAPHRCASRRGRRRPRGRTAHRPRARHRAVTRSAGSGRDTGSPRAL
ncbi:unnamed protein product, partial [Penicillium discolor]